MIYAHQPTPMWGPVTGRQSTAGIIGHLAGSVAAQIAAHAHTPVIVVRETDSATVASSGFALGSTVDGLIRLSSVPVGVVRGEYAGRR